jgi:hypothetical protein
MSAPDTPNTDYQPLSFDQAIQFYWDAPNSDPAIDDYRLTLNYDGGSLVYTPIPAADVTFIATGLTNNITYSATLEARNAIGYSAIPGTYRDWQPGAGVSGPPVTATATLVGATNAMISWTPPAVSPTAPIYWYVIEAYSTSNPLPIASYSANGLTQSNYFITGLNSNLSYYFNVSAVNYPDYSPAIRTSTIQFLVPFNPTQITGMNLWLDAQDSATVLKTGNNVYQWSDKSGSNNHAYNPTATAQPSISSINGYTALGFYGSNSLSTNTLTFNNSNYSIFFVNRHVIINDGWRLLLRGYTASGNTVTIHPAAAADGTFAFFTSGNGTDWNDLTANTPLYYMSTPNIAVGVVTTSVLAPYWNGNVQNTKVGTTTALNRFTIGNGTQNGTQPFNGQIGEVLQYNVSLTPFNRQKVEGYLAWKWGIQSNLTTSHPFRAAPPYSNSVFIPTMFSSLQLWLDGSDPNGTGTAPANGTTFTTWSDKSGKNNNAAIYSGAPLSYSNNAINTYSAPYMSNSAGSSQLRAAIASNTFTNSFQAFAVFKVTTEIGNTTILTRGTNNKPGPWDLSQQGRLVGDANNFNSSNASFNLQGATSNCLFVYGSTSNQWNEYVFGTLCNTFNWSPVYWGDPAPYVYIGERADGNHNFIGYYGEILLYNRVLSDPDRQTVEGYLAWKWGLQGNLPLTHPYKFTSPSSNYTITTQNLIVNFTASSYSGSNTWLNNGSLGRLADATVEAGSPSKNAAGNGVVFDGTTNFTFSNIAVGNAWSVSMWMKLSPTSSDDAAAWLTQNWSGGLTPMNIVILTNTSGLSIAANQINGGFFTNDWRLGTKTTLSSNAWTHVTYTWNGTSITNYTNGVAISTVPITSAATDAGNAYRIGRRWDLSNYIRGEIGQILIYNRALSAAEALQNYTGTSNSFTV